MAISLNGSTGIITGVSVGGLPDGIVDTDMIAAKAVTAEKRGAGAILQVLQTAKTDADSYSLATQTVSSNIIEQSITVAASSKVLIMCTMVMMSTTPTYGFIFNRGGTSIGIADADGSRFRATSMGYSDPDRQDSSQPVNAMFLDTPGSAGTYTYGVKIRHASSATQTVYVNLFENDANQAKLMRPISHFTLMEIAG